jgi:hypothetical protein
MFQNLKMNPTTTNVPNTQQDHSTLVAPPSPGLAQNTSETTIQLQILALTEQLETLEGIIKNDCAIGISGLSNLRNPANTNYWQDRVHGLLYDCEIPFPWFLEILPTDIENEDVDIEMAYVYFINEATKAEACKRLIRFINAQYANLVTIV